MKIRTQFYILAAGIIVVPLLIFTGLYVMQKSQESVAIKIPGYEEVARIAGGAIDRKSWERLSSFIAHRPSTMEFTVLDIDRRILFSTIAEHVSGTRMSDEALLGYIRQTSGAYLYQLDSPIRVGEGGFLVLTRIRRGEHHLLDPFERIFATLIVLFGVLFVFSAIMSLSIARSITESVRLLDGATRRIAAGELDRTIEVRGSNEITSLAASLNAMRLALKDDQARRSRFIMGVTHDLKTPLALIKGYAEAIGDGMADSDESRDHYVDVIATKVDQLAGMIDDLIEFVRVDTGEWRRKLQVVHLAPLLRGLCRRVEADAALLRRKAEWSITIPDNVAVALDERLVTRALENIINNALRYTAEGGLVRMNARVEAGVAVIEIADNGPGIEPADMPNIFDPFYRGSASRREQGMGLGLAVVKGIIDSHGWGITVKSEPGSGSLFTITVPLT